MILSILIIVCIGLVAYFNYLQGFFSAGIAAVLAITSAIVAMAYHESLVSLMNAGKFNTQANAIALVSIFALTYFILRVIFDKLVPGNVRFPVAIDKVGAAVCGLIAGIMGGGIVAIAAQTLPFGPSIGLHRRYDMVFDSPAQIKTETRSGQTADAKFDRLQDPEKFTKNEPSRLWLKPDDLVEGLVARVSADNGSLSAGRPWRSIHPDYLQEMFGQQIGVQSGSKKTALNGKTDVKGVYWLDRPLSWNDPEMGIAGDQSVGVRGKGIQNPNVEKDKAKFETPRKPLPGHVYFVVRAHLYKDDADDKTNLIAFGPAGVRLVTPDSENVGSPGTELEFAL